MKNQIDGFEIDKNKIILNYYFKLIHLISHLVDLKITNSLFIFLKIKFEFLFNRFLKPK